MVRHQQQLPTVSQPSDNSGDRDSREYNQGSGSGHRRGRRRGVGKNGQRPAAKKGPTNDELVQPFDEHDELQKTIQMASGRDLVLLYLQYGIYDSPVPASFLRSAPSILTHPESPRFSPRALGTYKLEECLTIVLTSEIGKGATGVTHGGTLELEGSDSATPLDVVVKLVFSYEQRDDLREEYEVYRRLRSKGVLRGIPIVLGLFDDCEDVACALVMLYAGVSLAKKPRRALSVSDRQVYSPKTHSTYNADFPFQISKSALSTLESIHRAGILHGDIRQDNILVDDSGVTIIDFAHSKQCNNQEAKDKEFARLRHLLGLAQKKRSH